MLQAMQDHTKYPHHAQPPRRWRLPIVGRRGRWRSRAVDVDIGETELAARVQGDSGFTGSVRGSKVHGSGSRFKVRFVKTKTGLRLSTVAAAAACRRHAAAAALACLALLISGGRGDWWVAGGGAIPRGVAACRPVGSHRARQRSDSRRMGKSSRCSSRVYRTCLESQYEPVVRRRAAKGSGTTSRRLRWGWS